MSEPKNNIAPRAAVGAVSKGRKTTMERRSFFSWLAVGWIGCGSYWRVFYNYSSLSLSKCAF